MLATLLGTQVMLNTDERSNSKGEKRGLLPKLLEAARDQAAFPPSLEEAPARLPAAPVLPLEEISGRLASQPGDSRSLFWGGHLGCGCSLAPAGLSPGSAHLD